MNGLVLSRVVANPQVEIANPKDKLTPNTLILSYHVAVCSISVAEGFPSLVTARIMSTGHKNVVYFHFLQRQPVNKYIIKKMAEAIVIKVESSAYVL